MDVYCHEYTYHVDVSGFVSLDNTYHALCYTSRGAQVGTMLRMYSVMNIHIMLMYLGLFVWITHTTAIVTLVVDRWLEQC